MLKYFERGISTPVAIAIIIIALLVISGGVLVGIYSDQLNIFPPVPNSVNPESNETEALGNEELLFAINRSIFSIPGDGTDENKTIQLANGQYFEENYSATIGMVLLGDLDNDSKNDAVVSIYVSRNKTSPSVYLMVVLNRAGAITNVPDATIKLDAGTRVNLIDIKDGILSVSATASDATPNPDGSITISPGADTTFLMYRYTGKSLRLLNNN
ncbi:MAG: hypothetical protein WC845_02760 [Candidatus Staskawiczbacteria bacterium]